MNEEYESPGQRLEQIRTNQGLSQGKFCEILGISRTSLQNYVRGDRDLPLSVISKSFELFSVNPIWLIFGDDSETIIRMKTDILDEIQQIGIALEKRAAERAMNLSIDDRWRLISQVYTASLLQNSSAATKRASGAFFLDRMLEAFSYQ